MRQLFILLPLILPLYVVRFHLGPLPTTLAEIIILAGIVAWTVQNGLGGWMRIFKKLRDTRWHLPLGLFVLTSSISILVSPDHLTALGLWRAYILEPLLIFGIATELNRDERRGMLRALIATTTILAGWALVQFIFNVGIPHPWNTDILHRRATGPFPFPNALALFAVPVVALCFSILADSKRTRAEKYSALVGALTGTLAILLAKSVGGMLGILAAGFTALVLTPSTRRMTLIIAPLLALTCFAFPLTRHTLARQLLFQEWSGKVRLVIWNETATMLREHPFLGAGLGAYPQAIRPYHRATWMEIFQYPHNILLNFWSETGLLGVIAFGWILVHWGKHASRVPLPIITAILIHGLVDVPYFKNDLAILFWLIVALTLPILS